jgi:hypothetical protein
LLSFDQRLAILRRRRRRHIGHTPVMPEGRNLYKYEILDLRRSRAETRYTKTEVEWLKGTLARTRHAAPVNKC